MVESNISEPNDLSQVGIVDINDSLSLFETKMLPVYNECNALKMCNKTNRKKNRNPNHKPWFNQECEQTRKAYHEIRKKVNKNENSSDDLTVASKNYSKVIKKAIADFDRARTQKLRANSNNPKAFSVLLKVF